MVFSKRFPRALLALGLPLTTPVALARGVNFGSGQVDARSGKNGGVRINWQEVYLKPGVKLEYALQPDFSLLAGGSLVAASTFGDGDAGGFTRS